MEEKGSRLKRVLKVVKKVFRVVGIALRSILIMILAICVAGGIYIGVKVKPLIDNAKVMAYDKMSTIDKNTFKKLSDTRIYSADGEQIGEINISNYKYAELKDISKYVQDGYIAVEDRNFAIHNGIDYKGVTRALVELIKNKGAVTQGGSTITQQVLKNNVIGTDINKWDRKLLEFFLAPEFEKMFSKSEIMEYYCNSNFYQNNCYGIETASNFYFGKSASKLTIGEAALLVGLSNNPAKYNPVKHPEQAIEKRHLVLEQMFEQGKITQAEFEKADSEELNLVLEKEKRTKESYQVSFAIHCAALKLMELDGFEFKYTFDNEDEYNKYKEEYNEVYSVSANAVRSGGYEIYTSLDNEKQARLQEAIDKNLSNFKELSEDGRYEMQGSATLINNDTQLVEAIVGGRGTEDEYNRGYQGLRQPGSSIKPLLDYTPAFDTGKYYPSLVMVDDAIEDGPKNSNGRYLGNMQIREAISRSTNTIAWKVLEGIGLKSGLQYLSKLRFTGLSWIDTYNSSMSLGGFTYGTTTFEMAKGYATLANSGIYKDVNCITKLVYQDKEVVYNGESSAIQVYSPDSAYMMLDCLKGVVYDDYGTGKSVAVDGVVIAGKTGTTNDKKDGWFCGVTNKYSLAVWCGYDTPRPIDDMSGGKYPGAIFREMIIYLHDGVMGEDFIAPETIIYSSIDGNGHMTDADTGVQDIFSKIAIDKLEEERRIEEERKRIEREEAERKSEQQRVQNIKDRIQNFSIYKVLDVDDVERYDRTYRDLVSDINRIKDVYTQQECIADLNRYYEITNSMTYIQGYRSELEKRKLAEAEMLKQLEIERQAQDAKNKFELITNANNLLNQLGDWENMNDVDISIVRGQASAAVERCKQYDEYKSLKSKLNALDKNIADSRVAEATPIKIEKKTPEPISLDNIGNEGGNRKVYVDEEGSSSEENSVVQSNTASKEPESTPTTSPAKSTMEAINTDGLGE